MLDYDRFITEGYRHRCVCGAIWTDSDGGPCHEKCKDCGSILPIEDINSEGYCEQCAPFKCAICKIKCKPEEAAGKTEEGLICLVCAQDPENNIKKVHTWEHKDIFEHDRYRCSCGFNTTIESEYKKHRKKYDD